MYKNVEVGSFIVRVVLGITFLVHGFMKFQGGIDKVVGFFGQIGLPGFMAYLVASIEVVGGICVLIGLGTRWFGAVFAAVMLGVIFTAKAGKGFSGGYEFELALFAMSVHLLFSGNHFMAVDQLIKRRDRKPPSSTVS